MTSTQHKKHHVRRWPASYYFPQGKKWISPHKWTQGTLLVDYAGVTFYQRTDRHQPLRRILFSDITGMRKATSTMIFAALVISVKSETHWFSSLSNRDAAYVIIEHFWRERLIPQKGPRLVSNSQRTKLGTELLQMAEDSQNTLQAAGTMLQRQGEQLDRAMGVMFDLQNDLNVAEKFISGFESWVGNWRLPQNQYIDEPIVIIDSKSVPTVYDFPVLYAAWSDGAGSALKNGTLRISRDGIVILDQDQINVYFYKVNGVSAIRVLSPWEMTVSKYLIGQPDMSYLLMSTHMVRVLKALEPLYREKMDLVEPPPGLEPVSMVESLGSIDQGDDRDISPPAGVHPLNLNTVLHIPHHDSSAMYGATRVQLSTMQQRTELVSEAEAQELIDVVNCMKSMAMDIGNNQAAQLEKIDSLTGTVDRANDRIKADTARIKQLL